MESKNGIIGLAIGDAMGVPVEFYKRESLMANPVTTMLGYGSHNVPKGSFSDDTSMTLATMDSIARTGKIDTIDLAKNFLAWMKDAKFTPTGEVFDIGRTTLRALARCEQNIDLPEHAGGDSEMDNGNGSLMRILPVAYYCYAKGYNENQTLEAVKHVSSITHRHEISILGCYIYVLFAIELLKGISKVKAYKKIQKQEYTSFLPETIEKYSRILKGDIAELPLEQISSSGYVVSTLEATFWIILNTENFNQAVIGAVNLGEDSDTVGACSGGLAGIIYGIEEMNSDWKIDLICYNEIRKLCQEFDKKLGNINLPKNQPKEKKKLKEKIKIIRGDITILEVDAIVNAANTSLLGGGGVDGSIHKKAGVKLLKKCEELKGCKTGEAKITRGYNLKAKYVIHTVAPEWYDNRIMNKQELLKSCYEQSFELAIDYGIKTIAFPCIGMGIYGCPFDVGSKIAIDTAMKYASISDFKTITLVCFRDQELQEYEKYFNEITK